MSGILQKNHKAAILGAGVLAGLLLTCQGALVLGPRFKDDQWEALLIEQEKVNKTLARLLEVLPQGIQRALCDVDGLLKPYVPRLPATGDRLSSA